jgi:hypothetical protein
MERGSDKHGAMRDDELNKELSGMLGQAGGHREDWREPELSPDDADHADDADDADDATGTLPGQRAEVHRPEPRR